VSASEHCCKVGRIAEKYDIPPGVKGRELDDHLAKRWVGDGGYPEMSLRELVDWIHKHMLRTRYTEHGRSTLEPHLESDYEVLQNTESDSHDAVLSDLEADGIDGESILADFISSATLYRHLTGCIDVTKDGSDAGTASDREKLDYIEGRAETYVSDLLSAWENRGVVQAASDAGITVRIYLECPGCAKQTNIRTVHQRGYVCEEHMSDKSSEAQ